jgi:alpha-1,6-mannosyltransferase
VLLVCLALAALWRVPFFLIPHRAEADIRRYVWDGRVQRLGYNPYTAIPADPTLAAPHTAETRRLNNPDVPSPYPAGAQLLFRGVTAIHESAFAFKVAFVMCDLAIVLALLDALRRARQGEHWVLAYAWHPLLAIDVAANGRLDILGALLLLVSVATIGRRWQTTAAIVFGLAVAVKFLPVVSTPLCWRCVRIRDALMAACAIGMLYLPFLERGRIPLGSLAIYVQRFRFNDPVFAAVERVAGLSVAAGLAVFAGLVSAVWLRRKHPSCSPDGRGLAHGSVTGLRAGNLSLVSGTATAVRGLRTDTAAHRLERQRPLHLYRLYRLASARARSCVAGSLLDHAS